MSARQVIFLVIAALAGVFVIWLIREFPRLTRQPMHARPSRPASRARTGEAAGGDPFADLAGEYDPDGDLYVAMLNEGPYGILPARNSSGHHEAPPAPGWSHEPHPVALLERLRDALLALPDDPGPPPEEPVPAEAPEAPAEAASENTLQLLPVTAFSRDMTVDEYLDKVFAPAVAETGLLVARHLGSDDDSKRAAELLRQQESEEELAS